MAQQPDGDLISVQEAAMLLEQSEDQVRVMIEDGLLTAVEGQKGTALRRAEVQAAVHLGG